MDTQKEKFKKLTNSKIIRSIILVISMFAIAIVTFICYIFLQVALAHAQEKSEQLPYTKYPSSFIYSFVDSCWRTLEQKQFRSESFWPDDYKTICSCILDKFRHVIRGSDFMKNWVPPYNPLQESVINGFSKECIQHVDYSKSQLNPDPA